MSDKLFRWLILANFTVAVIGGLILGGRYVAGQQQGQVQQVKLEHGVMYADPILRQQWTLASSALSNIGSSMRELAQAQKELAAVQRQAAENGRYQQVQTQTAGAAPQFFDTRNGELKPAN